MAVEPEFHQIVIRKNGLAEAARDFAVKVQVEGLEPGETYFYRFRQGDNVSETGTFRTAPLSNESSSIRFAYSGDSDGSQVSGERKLGDFSVLEQARRDGLDFFVYLGDTVYADSSLRGESGPADSLGEYRQTYKANREVPALRSLLAATAIYAIWDDHEVSNDFAGETVSEALFVNGRRAFSEYMPLADPKEETGFFRSFRWGKDADVIILDERSFRSEDARAACTGSDGVPDQAPAAPAQLRILIGLPAEPPPGCLETLDDVSRTFLGARQKQLLKDHLLSSEATFKFIINEVPIMELFVLPYDRWEGYAAERGEILEFIRDNNIRNVVFLTADFHATLFNEVHIGRFVDPTPIAKEFVVGPIAANTLQHSLASQLNEAALAAYPSFLDSIIGMDCYELDSFSYGLVDVNADMGTAAIVSKDQDGNALCATVLGP